MMCGGTFYVGTLKGVGRVSQQTAIDTHSKPGFAGLSDRKSALTAADLPNDHTRTKTKSPQTNGICERFHKTLLGRVLPGGVPQADPREHRGAAGRPRRMDGGRQRGAHPSGALVLRQDTDADFPRQRATRTRETVHRRGRLTATPDSFDPADTRHAGPTASDQVPTSTVIAGGRAASARPEFGIGAATGPASSAPPGPMAKPPSRWSCPLAAPP